MSIVKVQRFRTSPAQSITIESAATIGAQVGVNLIAPDGTLVRWDQIANDAAATPSGFNTTDDLQEGQWSLWFTSERAQDAVGSILANSANVTLTYVDNGDGAGSITANLTTLADTGIGALRAITRDAYGRITGTRLATITGTTGRVTVANGSAAAGLPTIDLATLADAGGGALLRVARDAWGRITGTSAATLDDISDVDAPTPADKQVLTFNAVTDKWEAKTPAGGGGLPTGGTLGQVLTKKSATDGDADWEASTGGVVTIVAGSGVAVDSTNAAHPVVSSTLGSISLSGNPANYAALPSGLGVGDAGKAYMLKSDGLVYIWDGTSFPASGAGVSFGGGEIGGGPGTDPLIGKVISFCTFEARNNTIGYRDLCGNPVGVQNNIRGDSSVKRYGYNTMKADLPVGICGFFYNFTYAATLKANSGAVIGTQDFVWEIDFLIYGSLSPYGTIVGNRPTGGGIAGTCCVGITSANQLYVFANSGFVIAASAGTVVASPGSFNKLAYEVVSGVGHLYLNGTHIGSGTQSTINYTSKVVIAANEDASEPCPMNFANWRFTIGANRYGGVSYTPLTTQFPFA